MIRRFSFTCPSEVLLAAFIGPRLGTDIKYPEGFIFMSSAVDVPT